MKIYKLKAILNITIYAHEVEFFELLCLYFLIFCKNWGKTKNI